MKSLCNYMSMIVFEHPIELIEKTIYGILSTKYQYGKTMTIEYYLAYLLALSSFLKDGGQVEISDTWIYPDGEMVDISYWHNKLKIITPYMGAMGYNLYHCDMCRAYEDTEVWDGLIYDRKVIDEILEQNKNKEGGEEE